MRERVLLLVLFLFVTVSLHASTTPAERIANEAAQRELDTSPPNGNIPSYSLTAQDLAKGAHLEHVRSVLHFSGAVWNILQLVLLLSLGIVRRFRDAVVRRFQHRWLQGFGFVLLFLLASAVLSLPLDIYGQWLRRSYGLSVQSWGGWAWDGAKSLLIGWLIGGLLTMLLFLFIRKLPKLWWLGFWFASIPITLLGVFAMPYIIDPLFNKFQPLAQSQPLLVKRLEQVARRGNMEIPPKRMFLMKASEKVTTLNAYVTGFGASKRVVVWDTSIEKGTPDEILFIFGHESGHYVLHHIVRGILTSTLVLFFLLYLGYQFVQWCLRRFGPAWDITSQMDWGTLVILVLAFSLFSTMLEPLESTMSRMQEHAADVYGQEAIHGIVADPTTTARAAFQVLGETSYDDPNPSQFLEFWTYSHPSIGRRAAFAAHYDPWTSGMQPKYFK
ncbi:MAG: M48 family metallopeptidase [Janthinobacterium lividum]